MLLLLLFVTPVAAVDDPLVRAVNVCIHIVCYAVEFLLVLRIVWPYLVVEA